jgi:hypothetical protein
MKSLGPFARLGWFVPVALVGFAPWGCGSSHGSSAGHSDGGSAEGSIDARGDAPGTDGSPPGDGAGGEGGDGSAPTTGWDYAKIGGGGFITGGQVAVDGTKFFRTDTSGGYLYDDTTGRLSQIVPRNLPAGVNLFLNGTGVYEAMIAPSSSKRLMAAYNDALYGSTDGGNTFTLLKSGFTFDSNSNAMRTYERHGQIDPQNVSHILFGDQVAMYRSTDGGMTWNLASGVPAASSLHGDTAGFSGVAFNPESALANGNSSEAIVSTGGTFFHTTDGGSTWSDISAGAPRTSPPWPSTTRTAPTTWASRRAASGATPRAPGRTCNRRATTSSSSSSTRRTTSTSCSSARPISPSRSRPTAARRGTRP